MLNSIKNWFEKILFHPKKIYEWILPISLFPLSVIYCFIVFVKSYLTYRKRVRFSIPIIAVSNLVMGGMGKTPIVIELAKYFSKYKIAIILRGYNRKTTGMIIASNFGQNIKSIDEIGDEAFLYSEIIPKSLIIVSENRKIAINQAKEMGAEIVILDDGFSKHDIFKDIEFLILSKGGNPFCLPAGAFREKLWFFRADEVTPIFENIDFKRIVNIDSQIKPHRTILITAISKPERLFKYIPKNIPKVLFPDHYQFSKNEIKAILLKYQRDTILTTEKDFVKLKKFGFNIILLKLKVEFSPKMKKKLSNIF
jgi:tetraacyldisaccharide 4'-kinase